MPSPFPGMDPYLEDPAFWSGFHTRFIVAIGAALTSYLPDGYYADVEQHVWVEEEDADDRQPFGYPDAYVAETGVTAVAAKPSRVTKPTNEVMMAKLAKKKAHKFLKVVDQPGNRLVSVIEVLSPSNKKPGEDRDSYLFKRDEYLATGTNLVEIDLLLDGERVPVGRPRPQADYYALVSRANRYPRASLWAFTVRDPMPVLPIPLKPKHGEIALDLRACLNRAYADAGYENRIDYASPPSVGLRKPDADWAVELLSKHSKKKPRTPRR
jgi:hypothetical protein